MTPSQSHDVMPLSPTASPTGNDPFASGGWRNERRGHLPLKRASSVQKEYVRCREVRSNVLCLSTPNAGRSREYRAIIEVKGTSYALQTEEDQESIIAGYQALIKSLTFPLQILVRNQQLDLSPYLEQLTRVHLDPAVGSTLRELAEAHCRDIEHLIASRTLFERHIYLILPADDEPGRSRTQRGFLRRARTTKFEQASQQLALRVEAVTAHLEAIGLRCHRLTGHEVIALSYSCLTPARAVRHPLTPEMTQSVDRPKRVVARSGRGEPPKGRVASLPPPDASDSREKARGEPLLPPPDFLQVADLIAPAWIEETPHYACLEGEYV